MSSIDGSAGDQVIDSLVEYLRHRTGQEDLAIEGLVHDFVAAAMQSLSTIVWPKLDDAVLDTVIDKVHVHALHSKVLL